MLCWIREERGARSLGAPGCLRRGLPTRPLRLHLRSHAACLSLHSAIPTEQGLRLPCTSLAALMSFSSSHRFNQQRCDSDSKASRRPFAKRLCQHARRTIPSGSACLSTHYPQSLASMLSSRIAVQAETMLLWFKARPRRGPGRSIANGRLPRV